MADTGLKAALLVSQKIRPYLQVVEGIEDETGKVLQKTSVFFLTPDDFGKNHTLMSQLEESGYDMIVAIGPEAASLAWTLDSPPLRLYTAILDPQSVSDLGPDACGISLRIPVDVQLSRISNAFPSLKKIGLLFDPANNQWFFDKTVGISQTLGITVVPLKVTGRAQIAQAIKIQDVDAIWMIPDQTIISEKIVQFVIKQGVYNNVGVIGYNAFFTRSGAVFSFEFDYRELGRQTGRKMLRSFDGDVCTGEPPVFGAIVNEKMATKIGLEVRP